MSGRRRTRVEVDRRRVVIERAVIEVMAGSHTEAMLRASEAARNLPDENFAIERSFIETVMPRRVLTIAASPSENNSVLRERKV